MFDVNVVEKELEIKNEMGLHARAAASFVKKVHGYQSDVKVKKDGTVVDGKSIVSLMTLAATKGSKVMFIVTGNDCMETIEAIEELVNNGFGEL